MKESVKHVRNTARDAVASSVCRVSSHMSYGRVSAPDSVQWGHIPMAMYVRAAMKTVKNAQLRRVKYATHPTCCNRVDASTNARSGHMLATESASDAPKSVVPAYRQPTVPTALSHMCC